MVNLATRGQHLKVKFPILGCVHVISMPPEYWNLHGCDGIFKGVLYRAERVNVTSDASFGGFIVTNSNLFI